MRILEVKDYETLSEEAAKIIAAQITLKPNCVLGLATGTSPIGTYDKLVEWCAEGKLDFSEVTTVNLDEYKGLDHEHNQSYWYFMHKYLFDRVNIRKDAVHVPDGFNPNEEEACKAYDEVIKSVGGIDLQLLGIGPDGHIGFNEPDDCFHLNTHCVDLTESTITANSRLFNSIDEVPTKAYTMGIGTIMSAKRILLIANGENKKEILKQAIYGKVTPSIPASILQMHADVTIITDQKISD